MALKARNALWAGTLVIGMLAGAGAAPAYASPGATTPPACPAAVLSNGTETVTCSYTGGLQSFTVPAGVTEIGVTVDGAQGGSSGPDACLDTFVKAGGLGGSSNATVTVAPGQVLTVEVGGAGGSGSNSCSSPSTGGTGGFGGGATGGSSATRAASGGGGGGASSLAVGGTVLVVGGGGGGGANDSSGGGGISLGEGGTGGGVSGGPGTVGIGCTVPAGPGGAGTASAAGTGGTAGKMENGDQIVITYNQPVNVGSTVDVEACASTNTIVVGGACGTAGSFGSIGGGTFTVNKSKSFSASTTSGSGSSTITITLAGSSSTTAVSGAGTFTPAGTGAVATANTSEGPCSSTSSPTCTVGSSGDF